MPRRLTNEDVRQKFIAAGYIPDNEFQYRNNKQKHRVYDILNAKYVYVSLQTLNYNIKKGHRPLWEQPGTTPEQVHGQSSLSSLTRFIRNHDIPISDPDVQQATFNYYKDLRRKLARQKDFDYAFGQSSTDQMRAVILALQDSMPKLLSQGIIIRLKMTTTSGLERYFHVNPTTLNDLWLIFKDIEPDFSVEDLCTFLFLPYDLPSAIITLIRAFGKKCSESEQLLLHLLARLCAVLAELECLGISYSAALFLAVFRN